MHKRIVYKTNNGGIAVIIPSHDCGLPVEEIARKDVPNDVPYLIVDAEDIPVDRLFRNAWEADLSAPHGVGIGQEAWFSEQAAKEM